MANTTSSLITITHTFTGWWVAREGRGMHIYPFTTEGAARQYAEQLSK